MRAVAYILPHLIQLMGQTKTGLGWLKLYQEVFLFSSFFIYWRFSESAPGCPWMPPVGGWEGAQGCCGDPIGPPGRVEGRYGGGRDWKKRWTVKIEIKKEKVSKLRAGEVL